VPGQGKSGGDYGKTDNNNEDDCGNTKERCCCFFSLFKAKQKGNLFFSDENKKEKSR
jgi:hypothetical protein